MPWRLTNPAEVHGTDWMGTLSSGWAGQVVQKRRASTLCSPAGDCADSEARINLCWESAENSPKNSPSCPGLSASPLLGSEEGNHLLSLKEDVLADYKSTRRPKLQC